MFLIIIWVSFGLRVLPDTHMNSRSEEDIALKTGNNGAELLHGGDLCGFAAGRRQHFHENEVRLVLRQILAAVAALHARGIAHCDIKPENILLSSRHGPHNWPEERAKLVDSKYPAEHWLIPLRHLARSCQQTAQYRHSAWYNKCECLHGAECLTLQMMPP